MKGDTVSKDKKPEKLFVRGLAHVEGEGGHTVKKGLEAKASQPTTLILGEEGF